MYVVSPQRTSAALCSRGTYNTDNIRVTIFGKTADLHRGKKLASAADLLRRSISDIENRRHFHEDVHEVHSFDL